MKSPRLLRTLARRPAATVMRSVSAKTPAEVDREKEDFSAVHFRFTPNVHPLKSATWKNPMQNTVWRPEEIDAAVNSRPHLPPSTIADRLAYGVVQCAYRTFNFVTRFNKENPTPRSVELRLLFLESIAGAPGMVAASMRHFKSLRTMKRDHGWIHTLLEEAENERMHLLVFMKMFTPGLGIRFMVIVAQVVLVTLLTGTYAIYPHALHRFVGYLEEMAVETYTTIIHQLQTPGTHLHEAWKDLPAPDIAKAYWRLPENALFVDVLRYIAADEAHHRDVNHTFASMDLSSTNPFIQEHSEDPAAAWRANLKPQS